MYLVPRSNTKTKTSYWS